MFWQNKDERISVKKIRDLNLLNRNKTSDLIVYYRWKLPDKVESTTWFVGFLCDITLVSVVLGNTDVIALNCMCFDFMPFANYANTGAVSTCLCTCIKTATWSGRARRGKHCALAVVLILFFQRLSASWWRLDCVPGRWCVCGLFCVEVSVWGRDDGV